MLLQVAPVHVRWHLVVAGEEEVQWVDLVIRDGCRGRGVVRPERMRGHHVEAENFKYPILVIFPLISYNSLI